MGWTIATAKPQGNRNPHNSKYAGKLLVIAYTDGELGIMPHVHAQLNKTAYVQMMTDGKLIGIQPCAEDAPGAYKLGGKGDSAKSIRRLACKQFSKTKGLTWQGKVTVWNAVMIDGVLVIDTAALPFDAYEYVPRHRTKKA